MSSPADAAFAAVDAPPVPARLALRPLDAGGVVIPYLANPERFETCVRFRRCWLCGDQLGRIITFVIPPSGVVVAASVSPPAHRDCALYSIRAHRPGSAIVAACSTRYYELRGLRTGEPRWCFSWPEEVIWWHCLEDRPATRLEVEEAVQRELPILAEEAGSLGFAGSGELAVAIAAAKKYFPPAQRQDRTREAVADRGRLQRAGGRPFLRWRADVGAGEAHLVGGPEGARSTESGLGAL